METLNFLLLTCLGAKIPSRIRDSKGARARAGLSSYKVVPNIVRCKFVRAKLRESFCPAAASYSRPRQAGAYQTAQTNLHLSVCIFPNKVKHFKFWLVRIIENRQFIQYGRLVVNLSYFRQLHLLLASIC